MVNDFNNGFCLPKGSEVADFIWHNDAIILTNILKNLDYDLKQNGQYGVLFNLKQT
jgi:hypothetical protein